MSLMALIVANASTCVRIPPSPRSGHEHCYPGHAIVFLAVNARKQRAKSNRSYVDPYPTKRTFAEVTEHVRLSPDRRLRTHIRTRRLTNSRIRMLARDRPRSVPLPPRSDPVVPGMIAVLLP